MKARQLLKLNAKVEKSTFNYVGFVENKVSTLSLKEEIELYSEGYDYKDVWETSIDCGCILRELEMMGIAQKEEEKVSYELFKYRNKASKAHHKKMWEEEADEIKVEKAELGKWLKDMKKSPEVFMRPQDESSYDGSTFEENTILGLNKAFDDSQIREFNTRKEKNTIIGKLELSMFDDVYSLFTYLASVQELRQIIHNNSWGICLKDCKLPTYPEKRYMGNLARILQDMVNCRSNDTKVSCFTVSDENITGKAPRERADLLFVWSHAPEGSVLLKCWHSLESLNYSDMDQVIGWQNDLPSYNKVDKSEEFYHEVGLKKSLKDTRMYLTAEQEGTLA